MGMLAPNTVVTGRNPVREALQREPEALEQVLVQQGAKGLGAIRRAAAAARIPVKMVPPQRLGRLAAGGRHQGVVAIRTAVAYLSLEKMLAGVAPDLDTVRQKKPRILALDHIQDPRNFGALVRSAVAAGVSGIVVPSRKMAPANAPMIKASAGTALRVPIARTEDLALALDGIKERGYYVVGAAQNGGASIWEIDWNRPFALVVGSEGSGLRDRVARQCDFLASIPMPGDAESLNVSVAAGIILFAATSR